MCPLLVVFYGPGLEWKDTSYVPPFVRLGVPLSNPSPLASGRGQQNIVDGPILRSRVIRPVFSGAWRQTILRRQQPRQDTYVYMMHTDECYVLGRKRNHGISEVHRISSTLTELLGLPRHFDLPGSIFATFDQSFGLPDIHTRLLCTIAIEEDALDVCKHRRTITYTCAAGGSVSAVAAGCA